MKYLVQSIHVNLDPRINVSENLSQKVSHESNAFQGKCMSNIVQHYFNLSKNIINCLTLLVCNLNKTSCYNSGRNWKPFREIKRVQRGCADRGRGMQRKRGCAGRMRGMQREGEGVQRGASPQ